MTSTIHVHLTHVGPTPFALLAADLPSPHACGLQAIGAEKKPARKAALEKIRTDAAEICLMAPFAEAAVARNMATCISLALAWQSYIEQLRSQVGPTSSARLISSLSTVICLSSLQLGLWQ